MSKINIFNPDDLYHPDDDCIEEYTYACEEIDKNKYHLRSKNNGSLTVQISNAIKINRNKLSNGKRTTQKNTKKEKIKKFGKYGGGKRKRQLIKRIKNNDIMISQSENNNSTSS